mmetsp:Transcript_37684/g.84292  ORF Transcript_37684/g.84292 Transcript_37684/m.84292 type:complete len:129 (+) Transcript_37684:247-633(+)
MTAADLTTIGEKARAGTKEEDAPGNFKTATAVMATAAETGTGTTAADTTTVTEAIEEVMTTMTRAKMMERAAAVPREGIPRTEVAEATTDVMMIVAVAMRTLLDGTTETGARHREAGRRACAPEDASV